MGKLGVDSLKSNLTNPARSYLWEVLFPNIIGAGADIETLLLRARSASIPGRSVGQIKVPFKQTGGLVFPGKLAYSQSWALQFIENEDRLTFDAFYNWAQQVVHDVDGIGAGDPNVKTNVQLNCIKTTDGEWLKIKLIGAFVAEVGEVSLDHDSEQSIVFPVTFAFDKWELVP